MTRALAIVIGLALAALGFFAAIADAEPETVFYAQTAVILFIVVLAVVGVATLVTYLYMKVFGGVADRIAEKRFSRLIGWKFLRSQRETETWGSSFRRSWHALRAPNVRTKVTFVAVGVVLLLATLIVSKPSVWNAIADAVSPSFATLLMLVLTGIAAIVIAYGLIGLLLPARTAKPAPSYRKRNAVTLPTFISIVGVAIGLWALIVVLGVIHGLQSDLRDKILRTNAHLIVEPERPDGVLGDSYALEAAVRALPRVLEADAYVRGEVMMSSPVSIAVNVVIKGMAPAALEASEQLRGRMVEGSMLGLERPETMLSERTRYPIEGGRKRRPASLKDSNSGTDGGSGPKMPVGVSAQAGETLSFDSSEIVPQTFGISDEIYPGILVGAELARQLRIEVGDEVQLISPDGDVGPTGLRPKLASFRVAGVFRTGMYEYDQKLAYTALYAAQRFFDLGRDRNALEARIDDADAIDDLEASVPTVLAKFPGLTASSLRDRNKNLFSALALERIVMFIILAFIVFVASLLIVSSLVMLVVEKVREIAVLKALGASDSAIVRSFTTIGTFIGLFGVLAGIPLGVGSCVLIIVAGFPLPKEFYLTELPVKLDAFEIAIFGVAALGMCFLATIYPSRKAAALKPADGLRHG